MTFNQSAYIEDAMNGFTMQETTFPYVCTIIDDASTDGEQEVIRKYLQEYFDLEDKTMVTNEETDDYVLLFAQHKANKNCYFAVLFLKYNHFSIKKSKHPYIKEWTDAVKYIAYCEGDDYWLDKNKLQRQVDFLEAHPDYTLFFHNALVRYQDRNLPDRLISTFKTGDFNTTMLFEKWQLPLASVLLRKSVLESEDYKDLSKSVHGGFLLFLASTKTGKVYGLSQCLSVYRKNAGGVSNTMSPAYCLKNDYMNALASKDKGALSVMKNKAVSRLTNNMHKIILRNQAELEYAKIVYNFDKKILPKAFFRFCFIALPSRLYIKIRRIL